MKHAESATRTAENLMNSTKNENTESEDIKDLKVALEKAKNNAENANKEMKSMKREAERIAKEYDRLETVLYSIGKMFYKS